VARYHRKSAPKEKHAEWAALRGSDRDLVRKLAAVLRVAIGLDRSHGARVRDIRVDVDDARVRILLEAAGPDPVELEAHSAELRRGLLEDVLGRDVSVGFGTDAAETGRPATAPA
jgi:exopolyphosphatase/guanosine-5'-triphosphate,3'-diphosphate pyrophosphatase